MKCAICGEEHRKVGSHVTQMHGLTAREYREKYGFDVKRGQVPEELRETLATNAIENGTAKNLQNGSKFRFKVGHRMSYTRSTQTMERLKQQSFIKKKISK